MRTMPQLVAAFVLLWVSLPCMAASTTSVTAAAYTQNGFNPQMLDPSVPQPDRLKLFAHVIALANQGQIRAQDLAGTLYWQGDKAKGSPVERNLKQAHILLANAAIHGDVLAMAKMGELELESGQPQKAMVWAQLYAHYLHPMVSAREHHGRSYAYASDLMQRIMAAGGKIDDTMSKNFNAMLAKYDSPIRDGIDAFKNLNRFGNPRLIARPVGSQPRGKQALLNGVAEFMVAFDASGSVKHTWLLASYPSADIAAMLQPWLAQAHANQGGNDAEMRYLRVPITYNSIKSRQLRPQH